MNKELEPGIQWFQSMGFEPHAFQTETWNAYLCDKSGLVNAPTGSGKTYSLLVPIVLDFMHRNKLETTGLKAIWITPIRALSKEIEISANRLFQGMNIPWRVGIRTGDTSAKERSNMMREMPDLLITTPESLHLLLASKQGRKHLSKVQSIVCDEWHELMGSKRGILMELALAYLRGQNPILKVWGISATIGNMDQALDVLLGTNPHTERTIIRADIQKAIEVHSVLPDAIEEFPWAGHLGIKLLEKVIPIINSGQSTLIFTNTRSQCEIWYQRILDIAPDLAGIIAMHHGSISRELREWVEEALHSGTIKAVVCTSSLDLGVDFRPVDNIIQIGSPKGVARFAQRAGRSGHRPGAVSKIHFVPTHSLELVEAAALRQALTEQSLEERIPYIRSFDVLVQFLTTLAVGGGFMPDEVFPLIRETHCFQSINENEWYWCLSYITSGGSSLQGYDEFHKVEEMPDGSYQVNSRRVALRHRLQIGTIVSDPMISVKFKKGGFLGTVEESFISRINPGSSFWFSGRCLELVDFKDMVARVIPSTNKNAQVPAWGGGRMPLSSNLGEMLRRKMDEATSGQITSDPEIEAIRPLLAFQGVRSQIPSSDEFLMEYFETKEGHHLLMYPYEGRSVHEGISALLAYRLNLLEPFSFNIAFNDYGFELVCDRHIPIDAIFDNNLLTTDHLMEDVQNSVNASEMARRRFREIAGISGLVFKGYPGKYKRDKHVQASSRLYFDVFRDYEPSNLLFKEAFDEALEFQLEFVRLQKALNRIAGLKPIVTYPEKPTPFAFPIMVERIREKFVGESLEDRVKKMTLDFS